MPWIAQIQPNMLVGKYKGRINNYLSREVKSDQGA
jgi:hypothetical protein